MSTNGALVHIKSFSNYLHPFKYTFVLKSGSGLVPLLLRVTTGTTLASVTQLSIRISALERENNREKSAVFSLQKQKSFICRLQHQSSKASCVDSIEQNLYKMVLCPQTMGPQMMLHS